MDNNQTDGIINEWNGNYVIAYLDILGFKQLMIDSKSEEVFNVFESIICKADAVTALHKATDPCLPDVSKDEKEDESILRYNEILDSILIYIMSDSIVVAATDIFKESLSVVIDVCAVIQEQLYCLDEPVLLRGAIAVGTLKYKEHKNGNLVIFGKGLVDAYLAQENYAIYPRIIIAPQILPERQYSVEHTWLNGRLLNDPESGYYYINTVEDYLTTSALYDEQKHEINVFTDFIKCFEGTDAYNRFQCLIDKNLSGYNDVKIRQKYIWLKNEIHRAKEKYLLSKGIIRNKDMVYVRF